ncbi:MAG: hypothetical protein HQ592_04275, partial [Planctomycetes bacterium]|nr:hypothetical protein [Planctomycetota bacterium]
GRPGSTPSGRPGSTPGGDPNDFLPGDEGPGDEGGEEKSLQVKMLLDSDKLYMRDGTTIEGTIIIVAAKWAIILTEDGERLIPREDIEKIERGKDKDATVTLPIQESDGFQFIVMKPIEEGEEENLDEDDERTPGFKRPIKKPKSKQPLTAKPKDDVPSLKKLDPDEIMELLDKDTDKELDNLLEKLKKDDGGRGAKPPPTAKW